MTFTVREFDIWASIKGTDGRIHIFQACGYPIEDPVWKVFEEDCLPYVIDHHYRGMTLCQGKEAALRFIERRIVAHQEPCIP